MNAAFREYSETEHLVVKPSRLKNDKSCLLRSIWYSTVLLLSLTLVGKLNSKVFSLSKKFNFQDSPCCVCTDLITVDLKQRMSAVINVHSA